MIDHCLEKQPSERPSSARDVAMFLDASAGTGVDAAPARRARDVGASARRAKLTVLAASCGLLLAVVAALVGLPVRVCPTEP